MPGTDSAACSCGMTEGSQRRCPEHGEDAYRTPERLYDLLGFMVGEPLWTHQLPRASRECKPDLLRQHPQLRQVVVPEWSFGPEDDAKAIVYAWLDEQKAVYGDTLPVTPLAAADHTSIDPITELRMMRPDVPIVVVEAGPDA